DDQNDDAGFHRSVPLYGGGTARQRQERQRPLGHVRVDEGLLLDAPEDPLDGLQVETLPGHVLRFLVLGELGLELGGVTLGPKHALLPVALGVALDLAGLAARAGDE